jgi:RNA polymerase primary sigma factor
LEKIRSLHSQVWSPFSIDQLIRDDDGETESLHDVLAVESQEAPALTPLREGAVNERLAQALTRLSPLELEILRLRFGLEQCTELTLVEIGEKYHLSRERIRQIQNVALSKLKRCDELEQLSHEILD